VETYVILRRGAWRTTEELAEAVARATTESERMPDEVAWIRSYVLDERDGRVGTICIYRASGPEAIRRHASAAELPVDEIVKVADTVVVRPDPVPAAISQKEEPW
jgi:sporulation protein YlmC with PRC-barrel domain